MKMFKINDLESINTYLSEHPFSNIEHFYGEYIIIKQRSMTIDVGELSLKEKVKFLDLAAKVKLNGKYIVDWSNV